MIYCNAVAMISALGCTLEESVMALSLGHATGMHESTKWLKEGKPTWVGGVEIDLPDLPDYLRVHNSRNNRLLLAALVSIRGQIDAVIERFGSERVGVILGTSTSGLDETSYLVHALHHQQTVESYFYQRQELGDTAAVVAKLLNLKGPCYTISTACSSGARSMISAAKLIESGVIDAAIVGGADTLNTMALNGFDSLEVLSQQHCTPFALGRDGINIGEGAALLLLTREKNEGDKHPVALLGYGESSDAWHMSAPHPEGEGAKMALIQAMKMAQLKPADIGYIHLHGTATPMNDSVEAQVVHDLFGHQTPCSSTKHLTGHTLGAAGCVGAAISHLLLTQELLLPPQNFAEREIDPQLPEFGLLKTAQPLGKRAIISNAFAFGGNNSSLILGNV